MRIMGFMSCISRSMAALAWSAGVTALMGVYSGMFHFMWHVTALYH
jgi:hypothetical protein